MMAGEPQRPEKRETQEMKERRLNAVTQVFAEAQDSVNHPAYYGGADNPYEAIKVIESWELGFCLGNTVKYISRAGKKNAADRVEDLEKAKWYLEREITRLTRIG